MSRIFLAIDLPGEMREALQRICPPRGRGVRPVSIDQLHLTLHFLGELHDDELPRLRDAVSTVAFAAFTLSLAGVGRFPPRGRASVLWAGVRPCPPLQQLHATLAAVLTKAGFAIESRPYTPHITLARLTPLADRRVTDAFLTTHASFRLREIDVTSFVIYESRKSDGGSEHIPLLRVPATAAHDQP